MGIELEVIPCGCYDPHSTIKRLASNLKVITTGAKYVYCSCLLSIRRFGADNQANASEQFSLCFAATHIKECNINMQELLWMRFYALVPQKL
jgi:hypothetical protein